VLETGEVALTGSSAELAGNPRVVESYLGFGGRAPAAAVATDSTPG
jgi:branched-chain amino acid transport system ATP-binding protein